MSSSSKPARNSAAAAATLGEGLRAEPVDALLIDDRLLLPVAEVARLLSMSVRTVWKLTSAGELPPPVSIRGCRSARWRRREIEDWIEEL